MMKRSQVVWILKYNVWQEHCFLLRNSNDKTLHSYQTLLPIYKLHVGITQNTTTWIFTSLNPETDRVQG